MSRFGSLVEVDFSMFFDRDNVIDATEKAERKVMSKAGAFVMRRARSSIRRRKSSAKPGKPPTNRTGLLKRFLFFGYDHINSEVVIGPMRLNKSKARGTGLTVPALLEFGGTVRRGGETLRYEPHPYMGPAMEKEAPKFPKLWRNAVTS